MCGWDVLATLRQKKNTEAMSQLTLNCLQEANPSAKPYANNGTEDRYLEFGGLGCSSLEKKKVSATNNCFF